MTVEKDYLDAAGRRPNFVTSMPYSAAYKELARSKWSVFPVYSNTAKVCEIVESLRANAVTLIVSGTGSGKTVIVPRIAMRHLVDAGVRDGKPRVAITNPKSVTTRANADFASKTWDVALGAEVGYMFRGASPSSHSSSTRAMFVTDGTLMTQSRNDPTFAAYDCVVLDEAHERSFQTDLLIARLRDALGARPGFRLVIMSATIDPETFLTYFRASGLSTAAVTVVGSPTFHIRHHWEASPINPDRFLAQALVRAEEALARRSIGSTRSSRGGSRVTDALVFVPTTRDANRGCRSFRRGCETTAKGSKKMLPACVTTSCECLYRKLPEALKDTVINGRPTHPHDRKIIFATPIAESSITFPCLSIVVDSGLQLSSVWLAGEQATRVTREMTSKAQISQRVGRVGRVAPGVAYHLYSKAQFNELRDFPVPAILATDLTEHFLAEMCSSQRKHLSDVLRDCSRLLTPPTPMQVAAAVCTLHRLGLVTVRDSHVVGTIEWGSIPYGKWPVASQYDGEVTDLGLSVQDACDMFRVSLSCALLLVGGAIVQHARDDALILACILEEVKGELTDLWSLEAADDPRSHVRAHCDRLSDHVSLVRLYKEVFEGEDGRGRSRAALFNDVWVRIRDRVERNRRRYASFDIRHGATVAVLGNGSHAPPMFFDGVQPLVRVVAFARRHRQLVVEKGKASSAGPIVSCTCRCEPVLALDGDSPQRHKGCIGGLYDELVDVRGTKTFSLVTWIVATHATR